MEFSHRHLGNAIALAADKHRGQRYGSQPYIMHPMRLQMRAYEHGYTFEVQAAAVLHDVVEDTAVTLPEIGNLFGATVETLVDHLTKRTGEDYPEYIARVVTHRDARRVKLLDVRDHLTQNPNARQVEKYARVLDMLSKGGF